MSNGEWIKRQVLDHYCKPPQDPTDVTTGDIWLCQECQTSLTVTVNEDQKDGKYLSYIFPDGTEWDRYKTTKG